MQVASLSVKEHSLTCLDTRRRYIQVSMSELDKGSERLAYPDL